MLEFFAFIVPSLPAGVSLVIVFIIRCADVVSRRSDQCLSNSLIKEGICISLQWDCQTWILRLRTSPQNCPSLIR